MYHDIVEHGDKVAIIIDKHDLPQLVFLLGRQFGGERFMETGYDELLDFCKNNADDPYILRPEGGSCGYSDQFRLKAHESHTGNFGWCIVDAKESV